MNRDACIALMLRLEGGYVNDPRDPGGATKYGITQKTLSATNLGGMPMNVKDLTPEQATIFYTTTDWKNIQGDALPGALAPLMLNAAVNMGEPTAIGMLQDCVGVPRDAVMGPRTVTAVSSWRSSYMPEQTLAEEFCAHVGVRYATLNAREGQYELGWFRRLMRVYTLAVSP